jgi:PAS domain S-box-containing protein
MKKTKNNPDPRRLRVLILEDNPADAELVEHELRRAKIAFISRLIEGKNEFSRALKDFRPQVILSDFKLPKFDGLMALNMARQQAPDTPLIFVSGSIGEEKAIEMLAQGASDYIFKDNLARLGPAVKRVVEETRLKLEKKKTDGELSRHVNELRLLAEASDSFVQINDLDKIYDYLAQTIREISGANYLLLSLYDEKLQAIRPKIVMGFEPFRETLRRRFHIDFMQMIFYLKDMRPDDFSDFVSRQLVPVRDRMYGFSNRKIPRSICHIIEKLLAISSMHTMGFSWENQLYGGLTIFFKRGNELKNASQIEALVNLAAVAIKRLLAEKSLRESEERFRHISATISDISYSCLRGTEGDYLLSWMTGAAERITGFTIEEHLAMKCWGKLVLAEDFPDFKKYVTGLTIGNNGICELRLHHKNGNIVWVQSFAECTQNPEQPEQPILYGGLVDISERKRVETALRESEKKYRTLVTQSPDGIFIIGLQGNFLSVNQTMCANLNYSEAEFLSMNIRDIVSEQYLDLHKKRLAEIMKGKPQNEAAEYIVKGKDGEPHYIAILSAPFYKDNKLIGFQGIARDITEKKKMEIRLRESEEYYRTLVETSPDAIIIVDAGGRCTFASSKSREVFGIPAQISIIGTSIMDFVEPGEIPKVQARLVEILSGRSLPEIREYRLMRQDRRPFWGEVSSAPLRDASGRSIGLLLVCRDVSERKRAEIQIQYQANLLANVSDAILATDRRFNIQYWNTAAEKQYGWTAAEVLGSHFPKFIQPQYIGDSRATVIKKIVQEGFWNGEILHNRRNGALFPVLATISEVRNAENQIIGHITIIRDITERKRAESIQHIQYAIANAVTTAETFSSLCETVRKELSALLDTTNFLIALYDEASGMLSAPFEKDEKDAIPQWPAEKSLTGLAIQQKRSILLSKGQIRQLSQAGTIDLIGSRAEAWLGVPLLINEKMLGAIVVQNYDKADAYDQSSVNILEMIASQLSVYIERKRAESQREAALEELRISAEKWQTTFNSITDIVCVISMDHTFLEINKAGCDSLGLEHKDIVGKKCYELVHHLHQPLAGCPCSLTLQSKKMEVNEVLENGRYYQLTAWPILDANGELLAFSHSIKDISKRKQAEEQVHASLKEKEVLLQEIHHRVKNNLQIISGLLTLQAEQSAGKSLDEIFQASQDRIRSIALIHEKLYRSLNLAEIAFDEYLRALIENLFLTHGVAAGRITVKYEMESVFFTIEKAIPLGLIVNELVTNSLKHAFPDRQQGEIRIGLHGYKGVKSYALKTDSGTLHIVPTCELIVADNGVGLPAGQVPAQEKTLGMKLVSMLAKQLRAELKIEAGPGAEFRLLFPGLPAGSNAEDQQKQGGA